MENNTLVVFAPEVLLRRSVVDDLCARFSAQYAMSIGNSIDMHDSPHMSNKLSARAIWLRHFLTRANGHFNYSLMPDADGNIRYSTFDKRYTPNLELEIGYYELIRRSYRLQRVVFVGHSTTPIPEALEIVIKKRGLSVSIAPLD